MNNSELSLNRGRYRLVNESVSADDDRASVEWLDTLANKRVFLVEQHADIRLDGFLLDAKMLSQLSHDSLLKVTDFFLEGDKRFLALDFCEGRSLAELLAGDRPPPLCDVVVWTDTLLGVLEYLHSRHIPLFHLNITPNNIRLTSRSNVKLFSPNVLGDYGFESGNVLTSFKLPYQPLELLWPRLDRASRRVLVDAFKDESSAELLQQQADNRSDLYSLAATIYHAATHRIPPDAMTRALEMMDGKPDPLINARELNPELAESLSDVLMMAMSLKREERCISISAARAAFQSARQELYDPSTNLPNRTQFYTHLQTAYDRAAGKNTPFAVLFIDPQPIRELEQQVGSDMAEHIKVILAERLRSCLRPTDIVARLTQEEFSVLLKNSGGEYDVKAVAKRLRGRLAEPLDLTDEKPLVPNIGIVMSSGTKRQPDDFFQLAEIAVGQAAHRPDLGYAAI